MKKKILPLMLTLFCLCGAVACNGSGNNKQKSIPEEPQATESECPDGNCPKLDETCPDADRPKLDETCPDGNCPELDETCPDGNCPKQDRRGSGTKKRGGKMPAHPVHPRLPEDPLFPPRFPVRPTPPLPEPNL